MARIVLCECLTRSYIYCLCEEVEDPNWQPVVVKKPKKWRKTPRQRIRNT